MEKATADGQCRPSELADVPPSRPPTDGHKHKSLQPSITSREKLSPSPPEASAVQPSSPLVSHTLMLINQHHHRLRQLI